MNKFGVDVFGSFCIMKGPNCPFDSSNARNNGPTDFSVALMVIWLVYECIVLFLFITAALTAFEL